VVAEIRTLLGAAADDPQEAALRQRAVDLLEQRGDVLVDRVVLRITTRSWTNSSSSTSVAGIEVTLPAPSTSVTSPDEAPSR